MIPGRTFFKAGYYDSVGGKVHTGVKMRIGVNLGFRSYWSTTQPFLNMCNSAKYNAFVGSTPGSQDARGYRDTTSGGTLRLNTGVGGSEYFEDGVYVLKWTGTASVVWTGATPDAPDTIPNRHTYTVSNSGATNSGDYVTITGGTCTDVALIIPGGETDHDAGKYIKQQLIDDLAGASVLRVVNWCDVNSGAYVSDFEDYTPEDYITFNTESIEAVAGDTFDQARFVPHNVIAEVCNRVGADCWYNMPHQATDACITSMINALDADLDPGLKIWVELGLECWNFAPPWLDNTTWFNVDAGFGVDAPIAALTGIVTSVGHGFVTEDRLTLHNTSQHDNGFKVDGGVRSWAIRIDDDNFKIANSLADATNEIGLIEDGVYIPQYITAVRYKVFDGVVSQPIISANYAIRCAEMFALCDAAVGHARLKHIVAGQASSTTMAQDRCDGVRAEGGQVDNYASAPYYDFKDYPGGITGVAIQDLSDHVQANFETDHNFDTNLEANRVAVGGYRVITYECGDHNNYPNGTQAEKDKTVEYARSSVATADYDWYCRIFADAGYEEITLYMSHEPYVSQTFGSREYLGQTDAAEQAGLQPFFDNGGVPKT